MAGFVEGKAEEDSDILEDAKGTQAAELSCSKIGIGSSQVAKRMEGQKECTDLLDQEFERIRQ